MEYRAPEHRRAGLISAAVQLLNRDTREELQPCANGDTDYHRECRRRRGQSLPCDLLQMHPEPDRRFWPPLRTSERAQHPAPGIPKPGIPVPPFAQTLVWNGNGVTLSPGQTW